MALAESLKQAQAKAMLRALQIAFLDKPPQVKSEHKIETPIDLTPTEAKDVLTTLRQALSGDILLQ